MMEYAQYQQPPQGQHGHNPSHIQTGYQSSGSHQGSISGASITSPSQQIPHSAHSVQQSPVLNSPAQSGQNQGHGIHPQMYNQPPYSVGLGMHGYGAQGISPSQAAAMAATNAAAGTHYPSYMPEGALPHASPRIGGPDIKKERGPGGPRSPQQMNNHQLPQGRRMSQQVGSPAMPNSQPIMNHGPRGSVSSMASNQQPQSPELVSGAAEESPLYVNAKQFHRILKRRVARQRLEEALRLTSKGRKPYLHESRHNHAMRRPRGPGGRFLTADEVAEIERNKGDGGVGDDPPKLVDSKQAMPPPPTGGTKRKSDAGMTVSNKKARSTKESLSRSSAEDEEEDVDDEDG